MTMSEQFKVVREKAFTAFSPEQARTRLIKPISYFEQEGEVTETVNGVFVYKAAEENAKVLAVAHLDSIQQNPHFVEVEHNGNKGYFASRCDDRLGAYVILDLIPELTDLPYDILLTEGEESGRSTAQFFEMPENRKYNWMFEFDREGTDVVMYQYKTTAYAKRLEKLGFKVGIGSFSDIAYLGHLGITGFNFGTGYYNSHGKTAHFVLDHTLSMTSAFVLFLEKYYHTLMPYEEEKGYNRWSRRTSTWSGSSHSYAGKKHYGSYNDWYDDYYYGRDIPASMRYSEPADIKYEPKSTVKPNYSEPKVDGNRFKCECGQMFTLFTTAQATEITCYSCDREYWYSQASKRFYPKLSNTLRCELCTGPLKYGFHGDHLGYDPSLVFRYCDWCLAIHVAQYIQGTGEYEIVWLEDPPNVVADEILDVATLEDEIRKGKDNEQKNAEQKLLPAPKKARSYPAKKAKKKKVEAIACDCCAETVGSYQDLEYVSKDDKKVQVCRKCLHDSFHKCQYCNEWFDTELTLCESCRKNLNSHFARTVSPPRRKAKTETTSKKSKSNEKPKVICHFCNLIGYFDGIYREPKEKGGAEHPICDKCLDELFGQCSKCERYVSKKAYNEYSEKGDNVCKFCDGTASIEDY